VADQRIIDIELDDRTIIRRNDDVEQEKKIACSTCWRAIISIPPAMMARSESSSGSRTTASRSISGTKPGALLDTIRLGLARFRRLIRDYFAICDSYYKALRSDTPHRIEAVDMARRAVHNEAAELLKQCLQDKVDLDFDTARRLFTLVCVLHIK
jgi:uncharacterized protein (UPF0262 family)